MREMASVTMFYDFSAMLLPLAYRLIRLSHDIPHTLDFDFSSPRCCLSSHNTYAAMPPAIEPRYASCFIEAGACYYATCYCCRCF